MIDLGTLGIIWNGFLTFLVVFAWAARGPRRPKRRTNVGNQTGAEKLMARLKKAHRAETSLPAPADAPPLLPDPQEGDGFKSFVRPAPPLPTRYVGLYWQMRITIGLSDAAILRIIRDLEPGQT